MHYAFNLGSCGPLSPGSCLDQQERAGSWRSGIKALATRFPASDSCQFLDWAGSVKTVFACTSTRQFDGCGCPAVTDGLDGF
jgi:hypothetical protein